MFSNNQSNREQNTPKRLPGNRMAALRDLHINPTHGLEVDESPYFLLYLNYALNNILEISGFKDFDRKQKKEETPKDKEEKQAAKRKLANFFWRFAMPEDGKDDDACCGLVTKIVEKFNDLRNYFAHLNENGVEPLLVDQELYVFLTGILAPEALSAAEKKGMQTEKLNKLSLLAVHDRERKIYEFTRKGLIFFISLGLYRDDAFEFTQCLEDMKLPVCPQGKDLPTECDLDCNGKCTSKPGRARAYVEMFTHFSNRRGRSVGDLESDRNYMIFADLAGYLNKVPPAALDYLALKKENDFLAALKADSTESDENKEFKYALHKRFRDRFLSFAAGYVEDFDIFPCLKFKRLDNSDHEGRSRYFFGKEHDNRCRMDRHYEIHQNAIRFEWIPKTHYGNVHIDSLRSTVSADAVKQLLFATFNGDNAAGVNKKIDQYFTAYHRILENMVNSENPDELWLTDGTYLADFATVTGKTPEEIQEDLSLAKSLFPANLLRFFYHEENRPDDETLQIALHNRLVASWNRANDFLVRLKKLNQWKIELGKLRDQGTDARLPRPVCTPKEVSNPPRECQCSDATLVAWVFRYFNLFLANDQKFRQLPLAEQHRAGITDHEYQIVHKLIGKYSLDPQGLGVYLKKYRPKLLIRLNDLNGDIAKLRNAETARRPPKYNKFGKIVKAGATLAMLAEAAAKHYRDYCNQEIKNLGKENPTGKNLHQLCRKYGVRPGMPADRNALLKTILHLDLGSWMTAFDTVNQQKYENRSLAQEGHIVSQIPFPNDFARRTAVRLGGQEAVERDENGDFDFNRAFTRWQPNICGRDFYDASPLVAASIALKKHESLDAIGGLRRKPHDPLYPADFSRSAVSKAIREIKEVRNQDKLLLHIAEKYWAKFRNDGKFICTKKVNAAPSIYDYFDSPVEFAFSSQDKRKILIMPNDVNRPILAQITKYASLIALAMDPDQTQSVYDFRKMMVVYREIQAQDRRKRFEIIPYLAAMDARVNIPTSKYEEIDENNKSVRSKQIRDMEFPYFHGQFFNLTREEYETIADVRNQVYHNGFALETAAALTILKKYVSPAKRHAPARRKKF